MPIISFFFIILLVAAAVGVVVIAATAIATARGNESGELYCGKCFYSAKGLTVNRCPECGSDLAVVGLVNRPKKPIWGTVMLVGAWAVLSPVALFLFALPFLSFAPVHNVTACFETWNGPDSQAYRTVQLQHDRRSRTHWGHRSSSPRESTWSVIFQSQSSTVRVDGDVHRGVVESSLGHFSRSSEGRLTASLLQDVLSQAYPDADDETLSREASEIQARLAHMIEPREFEPVATAIGTMTNSYRSTWTTPSIAPLLVTIALIGLIWSIGIIVVARWAHRRSASQ